MPEADFWTLTERRFYAIMIGDNANNGSRIDFDDSGEGFEEGDCVE